MKQLWKEIKRSWRSFRIWISFLFIDRWFDRSYLLRIIAHKCHTDAIMYEKYGQCVDHMQVANELYEVASLCDKLADIDKYYYDEPMNSLDIRWAEAKVPSLYPRTEESIKEEEQERLDLILKINKDVEEDLERLGYLFTHVLNWSD